MNHENPNGNTCGTNAWAFRLLASGVVLLLLSACSDYPTSGRLEIRPPPNEPMASEMKAEMSAVKGSVFELDAAVVEALNAALDDLETLKMEPFKSETDFARKYPEADFSKIAAAREKLAQRRARFEQDVARAVAVREKELVAEVEILRARRDELQAQAIRFDSVTAPAQSELDAAQVKLDEAKGKQQDIARRVMEATNKIILEERIPVPALDARYFQLSFETKTWPERTSPDRIDCRQPGRMWNYSTDTHVIIDERVARRSCSYYRKPSPQLSGGQYEAAIRSAFEEVRALNIAEHENAVKQTNQALNNAAIVARNETGIDRRRIGSELKLADSRLNHAELTQQHGLDAERILSFLGVSGTEPPPHNALASELGLDPDAENRRIAGQLQSGTEASIQALERFDPDTNLHMLAVLYESELRSAVVHRHIVRETPISENGKFSGLNGGAGLLVVVAEANVVFEHPKIGQRRDQITWSELTDLRDEAARKRTFPGGGALVQEGDDHGIQRGRHLTTPDEALQGAVGAVNRHVNALRRSRGANPV